MRTLSEFILRRSLSRKKAVRILKKAVTLIDIAKACDTSNVTVSKALAGKSGVSDALRAKIKQVADEMGYVGVKSTQNRGGNTIGVLIPSKFINPNGSFYWALYNALVTRLKKENMYCIMENLDQEDEDRLMLPHCIEDKQVSALISLGQLSEDYAKLLNDNVKDLVLLDYYVPSLELDAVVTNGYSGGYKLASYLIKMGHKKIGYIGNKFATTSIFDRYMGYVKAMIEHGYEVNEKWRIDDRDKRDFITMTFPEDDMPTAFVCNCDEAAYRAIRQLRGMGYNIPEDISIVGFDDLPFGTMMDPPLTTMRILKKRMGQLAVERLAAKIDVPAGEILKILIEPKLVVRESTARA